MRATVADLLKVLGRPGCWAAILLLAVVGSIAGGQQASPNETPQSLIQSAMTYEYMNGYDFNFFIFDWSGSPIPGAVVSLSLQGLNSSTPVGSQLEGVTGPSGTLQLQDPVPRVSYSLTYAVSGNGATVQGTSTITPPTSGEVNPGLNPVAVIEPGELRLVPEVRICFGDSNGTAVGGAFVTLQVQGAGAPGDTRNYSLGPLSRVPQDFGLSGVPIQPSATSVTVSVSTRSQVLVTETFEPAIFQPIEFPQTQLGTSYAYAETNFAFFSPLAGIVVGLAAYARERASGALEPIWAMPFRPKFVLLRRLLPSAIVLAIGSLSAGVVTQITLERRLGFFPPPDLVAVLAATTFLTAVAFLSLTVLTSHLARESGLIVGVVTGVLAFFALLWKPLTSLGSGGPAGYTQDIPAGVNPTETANTLVGAMARILVGLPASSGSAPSDSPVSALCLSIVWCLLPIMVALTLAERKD